MVVHNILHYKTISGSDICSKLLFLHMFTGCDATFSIYGVGKAIAFQSQHQLSTSNKQLQSQPPVTDHIKKWSTVPFSCCRQVRQSNSFCMHDVQKSNFSVVSKIEIFKVNEHNTIALQITSADLKPELSMIELFSDCS